MKIPVVIWEEETLFLPLNIHFGMSSTTVWQGQDQACQKT